MAAFLPHARTATLRRLSGDEGSGLTEFVIVVPLFILLIYWAQFFVDAGVVKLKAEEAARYAVWEMTAQRTTSDVNTEAATRYRDMSGVDRDTLNAPIGMLSFSQAATTTVQVVDNLSTRFGGNIQRPSGGGFLNKILSVVNKFLNRTVDWILNQYKFNLNNKAKATVTLSVQNTLLPQGSNGMWRLLFDNEWRAKPFVVKAESPALIADVWKAWPSRYWLSPKDRSVNDISTSPSATYPTGMGNDTRDPTGTASAPEKVVADRMRRVAFFGLTDNGFMGAIGKGLQWAGFGDPWATGTWREGKGGPIVMLPGATPRHSWTPGASTPLQRIGNIWWNRNTTYTSIDSADPGVDRARYTVPSRISTDWWTADGGLSRANSNQLNSNSNKYQTEYNCRDAFYLGSWNQVRRWGTTLSGWNQAAYHGCR